MFNHTMFSQQKSSFWRVIIIFRNASLKVLCLNNSYRFQRSSLTRKINNMTSFDIKRFDKGDISEIYRFWNFK